MYCKRSEIEVAYMTESALNRNDIGARTPKWVKVQGIFLLLLIVIVVGMSSGLINLRLFGFQHGPTGHGLGHQAPLEREKS